MGEDERGELEEELTQLRGDFERGLPRRLEALAAEVERIVLPGGGSGATTRARQLAHRLSGSAGTFGFRAVGEAAAALESALSAEAFSHEAVRTRLNELLLLAPRAPLPPERPTPTGPPEPGPVTLAVVPTPPLTPPAPVAPVPARRVLLADDDPHVLRELSLQLSLFGYEVDERGSLNGLDELIEARKPSAVLLDLAFPEGDFAGADYTASLRRRLGPDLPIVLLSRRGDLAARVRAARAGATSFVNKPVNVSRLVERLDGLTGRRAPEPYRALIVDDDPEVAAVYTATLRAASIESRSVTDPFLVEPALADFRPDLLLIDVAMPGCTGIELAAALRQQDAHAGTPFVFLSADSGDETRLKAILAGGDEYLTKPIDPAMLALVVRSRAERSRVISSLVTQDGLTGLLNHTALLSQLELEVLRARRGGTNLAFAMVDLDRFKLVNDTWGHPTGDEVLRSLARLLRQCLRRTDVVGRYGGEEFGLVLPGASLERAVSLVEDLRRRFGLVRHLSTGAQEFRVTLSAGVSAATGSPSLALLVSAADRALYRAKRDGRDTIRAEAC